MCKKRFFSVIVVILLAVSINAQTNEDESWWKKGSFFFGAGMSNGIFPSGSMDVYSNFEIEKLSPVKLGAYYELPLGIGNLFAGLEAGFASGSSFGGHGDVSFLPVNLNATYAFNIANILYVGPGLKLGIMGLLGQDNYNVLPLLGVGVDLELRYQYFPLSIYAQGGINTYPTTYNFSVLPTVEVGLRFPRGAFGKPKETTAPSTQLTGTQPATPPAASGLTGGQSTQPAVTQQPSPTPPEPAANTVTSSAPPPPAPEPKPPFQFTSTANSRIMTLDDGRQGLFSSVYFEPDTGVLLERYRPVMEEAGQLLAANPDLNLLLRTYTAPFGTAAGRYTVSMERGQFCRDYFIQYYGIAPSRITIEAYGSEREPANIRTDDWVSYRCAELIITE